MKIPCHGKLRTRRIDNASYEQYRTCLVILDNEYKRVIRPESGTGSGFAGAAASFITTAVAAAAPVLHPVCGIVLREI